MTSLLAVAAASAQTAEEMHTRVKAGQKVSISDDRGGKFRGRIAEVTPESLTLMKGRERVTVRNDQILRIDKVDDLRNGTLIGLLVGGGLFAVDVWASRDDGVELTGAGYAVFGLIYAGLGAGAGAGIDALIGGDRPIYQRGGNSRVIVSPTFGRDRAGAAVGISW